MAQGYKEFGEQIEYLHAARHLLCASALIAICKLLKLCIYVAISDPTLPFPVQNYYGCCVAHCRFVAVYNFELLLFVGTRAPSLYEITLEMYVCYLALIIQPNPVLKPLFSVSLTGTTYLGADELLLEGCLSSPCQVGWRF